MMNNLERFQKCLDLLNVDINTLFVADHRLYFYKTEELYPKEVTNQLEDLGCYYSGKYEAFYIDEETLFNNKNI